MSVTVYHPSSLRELIDALSTGARPVAGGTDVMVGNGRPEGSVIDLLRVGHLRGVHVASDIVRIGATTTLEELHSHPAIRQWLPCVARMAAEFGSWQIRNRATVGGNIGTASPAGDSLPVWLVLNTNIVIVGPSGRRVVPYREIHTAYRRTALTPGEIIEELIVPRPGPDVAVSFQKVASRRALAIAKVVAASAIRTTGGVIQEARVAAGSVAAVPVRLWPVEQFLVGRRPGPEVAEEAGRLASETVEPIDDIRSSAEYRRRVLGRVVRRFVLGSGDSGSTA